MHFPRPRALVGMVHLGALPGTPFNSRPLDDLIRTAVADACLLADAGFDALIIENMHDRPYLPRSVGPEIVAALTRICEAVRHALGDSYTLGLQILAGANCQALAVAHACGVNFIRAEGFVYASVADEGLLADADAGELLRYRRALGADDIAVFADIRKKHSAHALTADLTIADWAHSAEFFGADGLIVTGSWTGRAPDLDDLRDARAAVSLPILSGSGATPANLADLWRFADAVIVGSWYKKDGRWNQPIDSRRLLDLMQAAEQIRAGSRHEDAASVK